MTTVDITNLLKEATQKAEIETAKRIFGELVRKEKHMIIHVGAEEVSTKEKFIIDSDILSIFAPYGISQLDLEAGQ